MTPILLLAEAWGESEARHQAPLVGASGAELIRQLSESGIITLSPKDHELLGIYYATHNSRALMDLWAHHTNIHRTNVFNIHPPRNDLSHFLGPKNVAIPNLPPLKILKGKSSTPTGGNYVRAEFAPELERLGDEILSKNPNIILCLGNCALWALTGTTGITKLRGTTMVSTHTVSGYKLLPTFHPANILRNYESRPIAIADLSKALQESTHADIRRPNREVWIEPTLEDIETFIQQFILDCDLLSTDIETVAERITCIGFSPRSDLAIVIPFEDPRQADGNYWRTKEDEFKAWSLVRRVLEDPTIRKLGQNFIYDCGFTWRSMNIKVLGATEDSMLAHHALQPEALKNLGFLGSIYGDFPAWKHLSRAKGTKRDA